MLQNCRLIKQNRYVYILSNIFIFLKFIYQSVAKCIKTAAISKKV